MHMYVTHTQDTLFHRKTPSTDGSPIVPKISDRKAGGGSSRYTATYSKKKLHTSIASHSKRLH